MPVAHRCFRTPTAYSIWLLSERERERVTKGRREIGKIICIKKFYKRSWCWPPTLRHILVRLSDLICFPIPSKLK